MIKTNYKHLIFLILTFVFSQQLSAQISSTTADAITSTQYNSGISQDQVFIFCTNAGESKGSLTATTALSGTINYEWQKYDATSGMFQIYSNQPNGGSSNSLSSLADGAYRVNISNGSETESYTAWVFNNYYTVSATITESNCDFFHLNGDYESATLSYYDLGNNQPIELATNRETEWSANNEKVAGVLSPEIYNPPTKDTEYTLSVTDQFGCGGEAKVTYTSIVTKAAFSVSEQEGEAPLKVSFTNESENGTTGEYEWFIYKDIDIIKKAIEENGGAEVDSIDYPVYDDAPTITFEKSGSYKVKLVSKHVRTSTDFCTDTFYINDYIKVDTSFVQAPNFFTPNGDGSNDKFVIKFWSVKSIKISIFNRWGKKVHAWESNNVQGFDNTIESVSQSVWDGKIGSRMATPGVYYYVVEAKGRDDETRRAHGFVHLFRGK